MLEVTTTLPLSLETPRLTLRPPRLTDGPSLFRAYAQDVEALRYLVFRPYERYEDFEAWLRAQREAPRTTEAGYVLAYKEENGAAVGMLAMRLQRSRVTFGYVLGRRWWGRGLMTEALKAGVDWTLAQSDLWRAEAICDVENLASARVMEKAGMQREGIQRKRLHHPNRSDEPRDGIWYAKVKPGREG